MDNTLLKLITEFHKEAKRQGPGGDVETRKALSFVENRDRPLSILDIGCGTGAQTLVLASETDGHVTAVDLLPEFIEELDKKIAASSLEGRISTTIASMEELPFAENEFDLIWSEGAIYHMGFERGLKEWRHFLKPGGYIVVSEISWLTNSRPREVEDFWAEHYTGMDTISNKVRQIEQLGYTPVAHFILPEHCWTENYYQPIADRSGAFLEKHNNSEYVREFIAAGTAEKELYDRFKDYYGYVFYIAKTHSQLKNQYKRACDFKASISGLASRRLHFVPKLCFGASRDFGRTEI